MYIEIEVLNGSHYILTTKGEVQHIIRIKKIFFCQKLCHIMGSVGL